MAKECADKIQSGGEGEINQDALMKMMGSMTGMLGNLPKK
jgi:cytochrome c556